MNCLLAVQDIVTTILMKSKFENFRKFKIKRRTVATNRIKSGHTSLRESLFCFDIVNSPLCVRCDVCETPNHFGNVVLLEM